MQRRSQMKIVVRGHGAAPRHRRETQADGVGVFSTPPAASPSKRVASRVSRVARAPGSDSYAIAAKRKLISLLNVPEARLRGVGLHARAQDVVQGTDRRLGVLLGVLERHASIEQPVVPG